MRPWSRQCSVHRLTIRSRMASSASTCWRPSVWPALTTITTSQRTSHFSTTLFRSRRTSPSTTDQRQGSARQVQQVHSRKTSARTIWCMSIWSFKFFYHSHAFTLFWISLLCFWHRMRFWFFCFCRRLWVRRDRGWEEQAPSDQCTELHPL